MPPPRMLWARRGLCRPIRRFRRGHRPAWGLPVCASSSDKL